jgi:phosphoribosylglycinamide formyltransferase 1
MKKIVILVSGGGSNMGAIVQAARSQSWGAHVQFTGVVADRPQAGALGLARGLGVPSACIHFKEYAARETFEAALAEQIDAFGADLVVLAGFMRVLTAGFVERYAGRLMNIHPSLLPAFPGLHTHEQALAMGVKQHGATVHWVSAQLDHGPIIAQAVVPVLPNDTPSDLAARVLVMEHRLYPQVLAWWANNELVLVKGPPGGLDTVELLQSTAPTAAQLLFWSAP